MAVNNAQFIPGNPIFQPIRPLDKGIQLHVSPQMAEVGSLQKATNYQVIPNGLQRREAQQRYSDLQVNYGPIQGMYTFFNSSTGLQKTIVIDQKFIYEITPSTFTGKYWVYDTGTITATAANTTITGSGTTWDTDQHLQEGDVIVLDLDGSGNGPEELLVDSITDDTHLEVKVAPASSHAAGSDYEIRRAFKTAEGRYVDAVVTADSKIMFVDGTRTMYSYDGATFEEASSAATVIPYSIAYFRDRLYFGQVKIAADEYRYRIMWTEPGVFDVIPTTNYLDLPYQPGEIIDLEVMGNQLVAFFADAIYIGIPSQIPTLPVYFQRLSSGNIGMVGMKAVTQFFDSLFFVGTDDIYHLSTQGIQPIGVPIIRETLDKSNYKERIYAVADSLRSRIAFGFTKDGYIEELWVYDYRSKAWGMEKLACDSLSVLAIFEGYTIDGLDDLQGSMTIDLLDTYFPSIDTMTYSRIGEYNLYPSIDSRVHYFINQTTDISGSIVSVIETQDYDLGKPGFLKTFSGLSLKLESSIASNLSFTVEGSIDRGDNWSSLGTLSIDAGDTEGKVDFKLTGGIGRIRLTSTTDNLQYIVNEMVLKIKLRGKEVRF